MAPAAREGRITSKGVASECRAPAFARVCPGTRRLWRRRDFAVLHGEQPEALQPDLRHHLRATAFQTWKNTVQKELESHSSDSEVWQNQAKKFPDLFESVYGIGKGYWKLRGANNYSEEEEDLKGEEKKVLKIHKQKEYEVVKRNQKLINAVKPSVELVAAATINAPPERPATQAPNARKVAELRDAPPRIVGKQKFCGKELPQNERHV